MSQHAMTENDQQRARPRLRDVDCRRHRPVARLVVERKDGHHHGLSLSPSANPPSAGQSDQKASSRRGATGLGSFLPVWLDVLSTLTKTGKKWQNDSSRSVIRRGGETPPRADTLPIVAGRSAAW